jgi:hypothetical protein
MRHIPERYGHAVYSFGLFGPCTIRNRSEAVFTLLESPRGYDLNPLIASLKLAFTTTPVHRTCATSFSA